MNASSRQVLGDAVAAERKLRGLSVARAAALAGMSHVTWARIENGDRVQDAKLGGIDRTFQWPVGMAARILDGEQPPRPDPRIIEIERSTVFTDEEKAYLIGKIRAMPPREPERRDDTA